MREPDSLASRVPFPMGCGSEVRGRTAALVLSIARKASAATLASWDRDLFDAPVFVNRQNSEPAADRLY
jgi:hypothetical protein